MGHDFRSYIAMGGIAAIAIVALVLGVSDGLVGQAFTALAGLGGASVAIKAMRARND